MDILCSHIRTCLPSTYVPGYVCHMYVHTYVPTFTLVQVSTYLDPGYCTLPTCYYLYVIQVSQILMSVSTVPLCSPLSTMYVMYIFQTNYKVEISYHEIYNEKIHDLLASNKRKNKVQVRVWAVVSGSLHHMW